MSKVILVSQIPLPYDGIGSWTTMYQHYFKSEGHQIDILVCEKPYKKFEEVEYAIVSNNFSTKLRGKIAKKPHQSYVDAILNQIGSNEGYVLQIVDNFGLVKALHEALSENSILRERLYIQFFYHGYAPFYGNFESRWFFEFIDEMVLLTHSSYLEHKKMYTVLPCSFSVLHNGIDTSQFHGVSKEIKEIYKIEHQVKDKTVFLWCSQDRSKKGLDHILKVWKLISRKHKDIVLWVVGAERESAQENIRFFGKIPNKDLPELYQTADCYLFPTLWHEGFGLSLVEALNCGCFCIASDIGGVPEVLKNGQLGMLVAAPHLLDSWVEAFDKYLSQKSDFIPQNTKHYSIERWKDGMNQLIERAKFLLEA